MSGTEPSRSRILAATISIASEHGYDGATISKIATAAKTPSRSIYWHFGDKDGLMYEVVDRSHSDWLVSLERSIAAAEAPTSLEHALHLALRAHLRAADETGHFLGITHMLLLESRDTESRARQRVVELRTQVIDQTASWISEFAPPEVPRSLAADLAQILIAAVDGFFLSRQRGEKWDRAHVIQLFDNTAEVALSADHRPPGATDRTGTH